MHHAFKAWCIVSTNVRFARCAENIDAKKSRNLCGFGIFLSAFSATGSKRNYAPIFSMGEDLNEYMTVLKAAFVTFLHKS